jgi:glycerophosphoryl diester phosphodiesterase
VSRLGYGDPFHRLAWLVRGWRRTPVAGRSPAAAVQVIGHRGAPRVAAENTIRSFRAALDAGADAIETDVCVTRDGRFVLWHDANPSETIAFARQTGREDLLYEPDVPALWSPLRRTVRRLDWDRFRKHYGYCRRRDGLLSNIVGNRDGAPEVPVSTLDELLEWAAREPRLKNVYLDVKLTHRQVPAAIELMEKIESFAGQMRVGHRPFFHFLSQYVEVLRAVGHRERDRGGSPVHVYGDFEKPGVLDFSDRLRLRNVSMGNGQRLPPGYRNELATVLAARDRGRFRSVIAWTFNDERELSQLIAMGVNGILTDDPALLRRLATDAERLPRAARS